MDDQVEKLTPELALVDPLLAARVRALLPEPLDCLAPRERSPIVDRGLAARGTPARRPTGSRRLKNIAVAAAWLMPVLLVGSSLLAFLPAGESSRPRVLQPSATESRPLIVSRLPGDRDRGLRLQTTRRAVSVDGRRVVLQWRAVKDTSAYNLVIVRGSRRVDLWPTTNRAVIVADAGPVPTRFSPGVRYDWAVYVGNPSARRSPRPLARGAFVLPSSRLVPRSR